MSNSLVALQAQAPDVVGSFNQGAEAAQGRQMNQLRMQSVQQDMQNSELESQRKQAEQALQLVGAASMHALGGDLNGQADPARFEEGLDMLTDMGFDVSKFRGKPQMAASAARASMTAMQQIQAAQNAQELELAAQKFASELEGGGADAGLTPIYGSDNKTGEVVVMQPTKSGKVVRSEMPDGVTVDLGVKSREAAMGTEEGKLLVEIKGSLPGKKQMMDGTVKLIDEVLTDRALAQSVGSIQGNLPSIRQGSIDFDKRVEQLKGRAFLDARQMLKGGGAITDYESTKAEMAIARLDQAQSEDQFKAALKDFRDAVTEGYAKMEAFAASAGGQGGAKPAAAPVANEKIINGKRYVQDAGEWYEVD